MDSAYRPRRTCMSVPASSERFLAKARELPADEVMLDLEDSVAPDAKDDARELAITALNGGGWDGKLVAVRINAATTRWAHKDVIAMVEGAPGAVDSLIVPKVSSPDAVIWQDVLLGQAEQAAGLPAGKIRIEAQIEDAAGLAAADAIATASPRLASLVFGPADFMASMPGEYWRALSILDAYDRATSADQRGAVMLDDEMIDEASRKMALMIAAKGEAAGLPKPGLHGSPGPERVKQPVRQRQRLEVRGPGPDSIIGVIRWDQRPADHRCRVIP